MQILVQEKELTPIDFNFEELKKELVEQLDKYQKLIVIEEDLPKYKSDRASLNKLATALNDARKNEEKRYKEPMAVFKTKIDELIAMVKNPINELDYQLNQFETKRKQTKQQAIEAKFEEINDIPQIKLSMIQIDTWMNVATTMKKITEAITDYIEKIKTEIQTIADLNTDYEDELQQLYLKRFNLAEVIQENSNRMRILAQAETKRKEKEANELRLKAEAEQKERDKKETETQVKIRKLETQLEETKDPVLRTIPSQARVEAPNDLVEQPEPEQTYRMEFWVEGTKHQLISIKGFMAEQNIKFGKVG